MAAGRQVGIIGSGAVAKSLASGFLKNGWSVRLGTREPGKLWDWAQAQGGRASVGTPFDAGHYGEVVVLAVKGTAAESTVRAVGSTFDGKPVIDACNPIADEAPASGVLRFFTGPNESLLERLQALRPGARFVKAFSCVGSSFMVDPSFPAGRPTMFLCGDDPRAKRVVYDILESFGWEWADMGSAASARAIEPLSMLWCIPGLRENQWSHAFKLLRA